MTLWDRNEYPRDHWQRDYGKTQVIIIDDEFHSENHLLYPPAVIESLKSNLNIDFYYFRKDVTGKWDFDWFISEFEEMKRACNDPSIIFLDLMFGRAQTTPDVGSGIAFLEVIRSDSSFADIPIMIHSAGLQNDPLVQKLKDSGSCQGFLQKGCNAETLESVILEFALLSDPSILAFSNAMKLVALKLRKLVLSRNLKEVIDDKVTQIPRTTLLIGNSGDGKNFLANRLIAMSDRKYKNYEEMDFSVIHDKDQAVIRMFGQLPFTNHVGNYYRLNIETGKIDGEPILRPKSLSKNHLLLTQVGLTTYLDGGSIILNELGNSPKEMQQTLLTFLDKRKIQPRFYNSFVPTCGYYDLWVIITMQPKHSFEDLGTRIDRMEKIMIPSLAQRDKDIIPLASYTLDRSKKKKPEELFRPEALTWLSKTASALSVRSFTGLIRSLEFESSIGHFNVAELERAYSKLMDLSSVQVLRSMQQEPPSHHSCNKSFTPVQAENTDIKFPIQYFRLEMVKSLIISLEEEKNKITGEPNYPATWYALTGEKPSSRKDKTKGSPAPIQCHRKLAEILFGISNEDIIQLIHETRSRAFVQAVIQLGRKVAKERVEHIQHSKIFEINTELASMMSEVEARVNKLKAPYQNRAPKK